MNDATIDVAADDLLAETRAEQAVATVERGSELAARGRTWRALTSA